MKLYRVTAFFILICFIASLMSACAENTEPDTETLPPAQESSVDDSGIIQTLLPETDLDGFIMTILRSSSFFIEAGVYSDEITGEVVDDAVYERNSRIEERYNCVIELYEIADYHPYTHMHSLVLSADDTVDMVLDGGQFIAGSIADYADLYSLQYFNFDYPWWNDRFNRGISIGGKLYFTLGDYMLSAKQNLYGVIFNQDIAADYNLDTAALYEAAYNGSWTLDMMYEYAASLGSVDLNGDGRIDYNDLWAVYGEAYSGWTLSLGAGIRCAEKDGDDLPYITFGDQANNDVINKMMNIIGNRDITLLAQQINDNDRWNIYGDQLSRSDCYLFHVGGLANPFRSFEYDYGVLPAPKYSESQEYYFHDASLGNSPTTAVPVTATDPDIVSFILEAMAYDSHYNVLPVFYDNYLHTKLARDEDSVEMLKIIHDTVYYDIGALFNWGEMRMIIENISEGSENNFATEYARNEKQINKALDKTLSEISD
ncbi:MAG: hypothetical protein PHZ09_01395 [Eubacteriales bacterium]|jgi:hypothetical protein|nr:hypothetical protein [Eubacteriales bacterium]